MYQSQSSGKALDGVAIVSAIMGVEDPKDAASQFVKLIARPPPFASISQFVKLDGCASLMQEVPNIVRKMVKQHPLVHNMINYVVANFAANVALSM